MRGAHRLGQQSIQPAVVPLVAEADEEHEQHGPHPREALLGVRIVGVAARAGRQLGEVGQRRAERDVDLGAGVHRPAVGVEDRAEVALAQLQVREHHRRQRDQQHHADDADRHASGPSSNSRGVADQRRDEGADAADRDAQRGDRADVDLLGLGAAAPWPRRTWAVVVALRRQLRVRVRVIGGGGALGDLLLDAGGRTSCTATRTPGGC